MAFLPPPKKKKLSSCREEDRRLVSAYDQPLHTVYKEDYLKLKNKQKDLPYQQPLQNVLGKPQILFLNNIILHFLQLIPTTM